MRELVFVYGSLKKGLYNHRLLETSEFLGEAITAPEYTMVSLGAFPAVVLEGNTAITGELYRVDEDTMGWLDQLEGYPDFYDRRKIEIPGRTEWPWIYYMDELVAKKYNHTLVEDGVWQPRH